MRKTGRFHHGIGTPTQIPTFPTTLLPEARMSDQPEAHEPGTAPLAYANTREAFANGGLPETPEGKQSSVDPPSGPDTPEQPVHPENTGGTLADVAGQAPASGLPEAEHQPDPVRAGATADSEPKGKGSTSTAGSKSSRSKK